MIYELPKLLPVFLTILFVACTNASTVDNEPSKTADIQLIDSLGTASFSIPRRYDTSFSWVHESDCGPCSDHKYRFQPKELPITKESGWIWKGEPKDSIERFTISHTEEPRFTDEDTTMNISYHNQIKEGLNNERMKYRMDEPSIVFDTFEKVNGRYYSIFAMEKSDSLYSKKIMAITTIKGVPVTFQYDLLTRKNDSITKNFIKNSIELIRTIRINAPGNKPTQ